MAKCKNKNCKENKIRKDGYCSTVCFNKITKQVGIDGWKKCLFCELCFPYRKSAKSRSVFCKRLNRMVGSVKQKFCCRKCALLYRNKYKNPAQTLNAKKKIGQKMSQRLKGKKRNREWVDKQRESIKGQNHWNWQGGITELNKRDRNRYEAKAWRKMVFDRDNYTCQMCNIRGGYLEADHIKPWSLFPELRYCLDNGRTLCKDCHKKTDTYMGRIKQYKEKTPNRYT